MRDMPRIDVKWLDGAGALYLAALRARAPLDKTTARFLRDHRYLGDDGRGFVVDVAQGMWRMRARVEKAAAALSYEPTRGALVALYLAGTNARDDADIPVDPRGLDALRAAWSAASDAH